MSAGSSYDSVVRGIRDGLSNATSIVGKGATSFNTIEFACGALKYCDEQDSWTMKYQKLTPKLQTKADGDGALKMITNERIHLACLASKACERHKPTSRFASKIDRKNQTRVSILKKTAKETRKRKYSFIDEHYRFGRSAPKEMAVRLFREAEFISYLMCARRILEESMKLSLDDENDGVNINAMNEMRRFEFATEALFWPRKFQNERSQPRPINLQPLQQFLQSRGVNRFCRNTSSGNENMMSIIDECIHFANRYTDEWIESKSCCWEIRNRRHINNIEGGSNNTNQIARSSEDGSIAAIDTSRSAGKRRKKIGKQITIPSFGKILIRDFVRNCLESQSEDFRRRSSEGLLLESQKVTHAYSWDFDSLAVPPSKPTRQSIESLDAAQILSRRRKDSLPRRQCNNTKKLTQRLSTPLKSLLIEPSPQSINSQEKIRRRSRERQSIFRGDPHETADDDSTYTEACSDQERDRNVMKKQNFHSVSPIEQLGEKGQRKDMVHSGHASNERDRNYTPRGQSQKNLSALDDQLDDMMPLIESNSPKPLIETTSNSIAENKSSSMNEIDVPMADEIALGKSFLLSDPTCSQNSIDTHSRPIVTKESSPAHHIRAPLATDAIVAKSGFNSGESISDASSFTKLNKEKGFESPTMTAMEACSESNSDSGRNEEKEALVIDAIRELPSYQWVPLSHVGHISDYHGFKRKYEHFSPLHFGSLSDIRNQIGIALTKNNDESYDEVIQENNSYDKVIKDYQTLAKRERAELLKAKRVEGSSKVVRDPIEEKRGIIPVLFQPPTKNPVLSSSMTNLTARKVDELFALDDSYYGAPEARYRFIDKEDSPLFIHEEETMQNQSRRRKSRSAQITSQKKTSLRVLNELLHTLDFIEDYNKNTRATNGGKTSSEKVGVDNTAENEYPVNVSNGGRNPVITGKRGTDQVGEVTSPVIEFKPLYKPLSADVHLKRYRSLQERYPPFYCLKAKGGIQQIKNEIDNIVGNNHVLRAFLLDKEIVSDEKILSRCIRGYSRKADQEKIEKKNFEEEQKLRQREFDYYRKRRTKTSSEEMEWTDFGNRNILFIPRASSLRRKFVTCKCGRSCWICFSRFGEQSSGCDIHFPSIRKVRREIYNPEVNSPERNDIAKKGTSNHLQLASALQLLEITHTLDFIQRYNRGMLVSEKRRK